MSTSDVIQSIKSKFDQPIKPGQQRHIVFWMDEEQQFEIDFNELEIEGVYKHRLTGSNFLHTKLLLEKEDTSNHYLIYCPLKFEVPNSNWLMDIFLYSEVFRADFVSLLIEELNLSDNIDFRKTIKRFSPFFKSSKRVNKLQSYMTVFKNTDDLIIGMFAVLANAKKDSLVDILYALLEEGLNKQSNDVYLQFEKYGDILELDRILSQKGIVEGFNEKSLLNVFASIACTAAYHKVNDLNDLSDIKDFIHVPYAHTCYDVMNEMIHDQSKDHKVRDVLIEVEDFLKIPERLQKIDISKLAHLEIFPIVNAVLFNEFVQSLIKGVYRIHEMIEIIEKRRELKWYNRNSTFFEALSDGARMIQYTLDHPSGIDSHGVSKLWELYQQDYYLMDQMYRHFIFSYTKSVSDGNVLFDDGIKQLGDYVEDVYKNWFLENLGQKWSSALESANYQFRDSNIKMQIDFYKEFVAKHVGEGVRTFVIVSDGLRYEVAKELNNIINSEIKGTSSISAMSTLVPSTTKIGMAALLPNDGLSYKDDVVFLNGIKPDSLENRAKILKLREVDSEAIHAPRFLEMKRSERSELVKFKKLVYIYHNQIDTIGDKPTTEKQVFQACRTAIEDIKSLVRILVNEFSATNVYITSDHGFIYTHKPLKDYDQLSVNVEKDQQTIINRRFMISENADDNDRFHKVQLKEIGSDYYLTAPKQYIRFKAAGGGSNYVHGGMSIQEMMVPVVAYKSSKSDSTSTVFNKVQVELINEVHKITNLTFSLRFIQTEALKDKMLPSKIYLQFEDILGNQISDKQIIIADKTSLNIKDREFKKYFTLRSQKYDSNATYYLVIGEQDDKENPVIKKIEFKISVLISDDFGL